MENLRFQLLHDSRRIRKKYRLLLEQDYAARLLQNALERLVLCSILRTAVEIAESESHASFRKGIWLLDNVEKWIIPCSKQFLSEMFSIVKRARNSLEPSAHTVCGRHMS
ncbi:hypothetical protein HNY73_001747 [Argiope bruennichi]|uniref:Uncharacterized protein n=1 Tax=Argiope bruennichi TaxID=94029 RepID=A0A8T0FRH5_ARGBR|nr:hypothetical protein HNY73_001747 [Argiope bruennichi]